MVRDGNSIKIFVWIHSSVSCNLYERFLKIDWQLSWPPVSMPGPQLLVVVVSQSEMHFNYVISSLSMPILGPPRSGFLLFWPWREAKVERALTHSESIPVQPAAPGLAVSQIFTAQLIFSWYLNHQWLSPWGQRSSLGVAWRCLP